MDAAKFLIPSAGNLAINLGIISLIITMALLVETFYSRRLPYRIKRFMKKFFGFAFFLGALHAFIIPSDISNSWFLKIYFLIICIAALWSFVYRSFFENVLVKKYLYTVEAVNVLGQGITEIIMRPQLQRMEYLPGQFVFLSIVGEGVDDEVHPFTVSSSPAEEHLGITIKALGDWSTDIQNLKVGAIARVEGPFGHFSYLNAHQSKQIWVGGGVGVTPFLSFLRTLRVNNRDDLWVDFYYATKSADQMIFRPEIEQIVQQCPNVRLIPHASDDSGFLSADIIEAQSKNIQNAEIFVCGPPPMMRSLAAQFSNANVPKHLVHMEAFKLL
jgi:predicted ferric reductase